MTRLAIEKLLKSASALVSCVAGAVLVDETLKIAENAGFTDIRIDEKAYDIDVMMADCSDPLYRQVKEFLPQNTKLSDYIVSVNITALKNNR